MFTVLLIKPYIQNPQIISKSAKSVGCTMAAPARFTFSWGGGLMGHAYGVLRVTSPEVAERQFKTPSTVHARSQGGYGGYA